MSAPWAPVGLRAIFAAADMGSRCFGGCPPRLSIIDGDAWVCGCAIRRTAAECKRARHVSVMFNLGPEHTLPAAATSLRRAVLEGAGKAIAAARPFSGTAAAYIDRRDVDTAEALGVDAWRWFTVGPTPALLGMRGGDPVAVIALMARQRAAFERLVGAS